MANQKLTQEELQTITQLQQQNQAITMELGNIELNKLNIEARRAGVMQAMEELRKAEQELATSLQENYGAGTINLQTGEFEPAPAQEEAPEVPVLEGAEE